MVDWLIIHGIRILAIILIAVASYFLLRRLGPSLIKRTVMRGRKKQRKKELEKRADTLSSFVVKTGIIIIAILAIFAILSEAGVNMTAILAGLGILGLAISFGAQSLIKDVISGIFVLTEDQYAIGDWVGVAGVSGTVQEISLRRTILRDFDGTLHSVPNGEIKIASNFTKAYARVNLNVSVAYGENLDHVIEVINRVCQELAEDEKWKPHIISIPKVLRVDNLGDSGIDIKILGDTKAGHQWATMGEIRLRLKRTFDEEGIEIPWPHTKVYFGNSLNMIKQPQLIPDESTDTKDKPS